MVVGGQESPDLLPCPGTLAIFDCKAWGQLQEAHRGRRLLCHAEEELGLFLSRHYMHRDSSEVRKIGHKGIISHQVCRTCLSSAMWTVRASQKS